MIAYDNNYKFTVVDCGAYDNMNNDIGMFSRSAFDKALFSDKLNLPWEECTKKNLNNYANGFHKISVIACLRFDFSGSGILSNSVATNKPKLLSGVKLLKFQANC